MAYIVTVSNFSKLLANRCTVALLILYRGFIIVRVYLYVLRALRPEEGIGFPGIGFTTVFCDVDAGN